MSLLTSEEISKNCKIMAADFRDTHALFHDGVGRFIGYNRDGVMKFGKKPLSLVNGLWFLEEDNNVNISNISAMSLRLAIIE